MWQHSNPFSTAFNKLCALLLLAAVISASAHAQFFDSLSLKAGTEITVATKDYQPLWIVANKFGTITDQQADASTFIRASNKHVLLRDDYLNDSILAEQHDLLVVKYGISLYNNNHFRKLLAEEVYGKLEYKNWSLRIGRFEEITGDIDKDLSSGSLGISGNALPIPKIGIAVTDYTNVPFTNGWLQFKGTFAHGWFGNNRYMKDAFYHEKTLYIRLGSPKFKVYGGLQHFAEWGGRRGAREMERSWKGFWDVFWVSEADDGSVGTSVNDHPPSRPGDQRGVVEAGFYWDDTKLALHGYSQMPFESGEEFDLQNRSVLAGLSLIPKESNVLKKILLEVIYTKQMNDFVDERQRQSYYNNGYYKTGWEYEDHIIGTPLFINRQRASQYFPGIQPYDWDAPDETIQGNNNIINNRLFGIHAGGLYDISDQIKAKTLLTFTNNYGTWAEGPFTPNKIQFYILQDMLIQPLYSRWTFHAGLGFDFGDLASNLGAIVGCSYKIF